MNSISLSAVDISESQYTDMGRGEENTEVGKLQKKSPQNVVS